MSHTNATGIARRHDLDALRAWAMMLGIVLHGALAFTGGPWIVRDIESNPLFGLLVAAIHGFRMPLFIFVSGFFTMMLYRRRGLPSLLKQRFWRVAVPCLLGLATIIPLTNWVTEWAIARSAHQDAIRLNDPSRPRSLLDALRLGDYALLKSQLDAGADLNQPDPEFRLAPLHWAAILGDEPAATALLDAGADLKKVDTQGNGPVHAAAAFGHLDVLERLAERGADLSARSNSGETAVDHTQADWAAMQSIADLLRVPFNDREAIQAGRERCRQFLVQNGVTGQTPGSAPASAANSPLDRMRTAYAAWLTSDRLNVKIPGQDAPFHLILTPVFGHLWFLWTLVWLVAGFAVIAVLAQRSKLQLPALPRRLLLTPARWLWLIPLTMIPQLFMGVLMPSFGPDTSIGLLPQPHILLYYAVFFAVGAFYYDCHDDDGRLGRHWAIGLSLALAFLLLPGLMTVGQPLLTGPIQLAYTWVMTFGLMGLFRKTLSRENRAIRYLSDSAYWLYLAHLPLIIALQALVREWPLPAIVKFLFIGSTATVLLLVSYELFVRYTPLGRLLNGPRTRPARRHRQPAHETSDLADAPA